VASEQLASYLPAAHEIPVLQAYEHLPAAHEIPVLQAHEHLPAAHELRVLQAYELHVLQAYEHLPAAHELCTDSRRAICRPHELLAGAHELLISSTPAARKLLAGSSRAAARELLAGSLPAAYEPLARAPKLSPPTRSRAQARVALKLLRSTMQYFQTARKPRDPQCASEATRAICKHFGASKRTDPTY